MSTAALLLVDVGGGGLGLILLVVGRGGLILLVVVVVIASIEICLLFFRMAKEHSVRIALNNDEAIRAHIHYVPATRELVVAIYAHWGHLGEIFLQLCFNVFFHECRHAK